MNRNIEWISANPDGAVATLSELVWRYDYNGLGLVEAVTDPAGAVTSYTYDERNRLESETTADPDGAGALVALVTSYDYDCVGNLTKITLPAAASSNTSTMS